MRQQAADRDLYELRRHEAEPVAEQVTTDRDLMAAAIEFVRAAGPSDERHAAEILVRWERASELTYDQAATIVGRFRHRVVIRLDGGDYEVRCQAGDLVGRAATLKAAEQARRAHHEQHHGWSK
jgi:hypothetical protein